jgi:tetratricopeptide (TPR) repeat protein
MRRFHPRLSNLLVMVSVAGLAVGAVGSAAAMGPEPNPTLSQPPTSSGQPAQSDAAKKKKTKASKSKPKDQRSEQFPPGFWVAYDLIYKRHDYAAGIAELRALHRDDNADVANLIGYSSRKLGRYADSKAWYERALAADPQHARTWSYYGMWHAEQGNMLKARDYLEKVRSICGTGCREYTELKGVIEGTLAY